ncbi:MAG: hypothetical protein R3F30_06595 [Planctomycetota bacterium]
MQQRGRWTPFLVLAAVSLVLGACGLLGRAQDVVPVQGWNKARGPVVPHDKFPDDCTLCHEGPGWNTIRQDFTFDHLARTGVPLNGEHARAECLRCHNDSGPVAVFAARGCAGCHEDWHRGTLGKDCKVCHDEESWHPREQIARHNLTRFPLVGAHAGVACWACHEGAPAGEFQKVSTDCASCHLERALKVTSPNHAGNGWTSNCQRCHSPIAWKGAAIVHDFFPLVGGHATAACTDCHKNNVFQGTPRDCYSCHQTDFQGTTNPNHQTANFSTQCQVCHNTFGWTGANFIHQWPLTGAHKSTACDKCHVGGVYAGTPKDCWSCHQADYLATTNPNHQTLNYPQDCAACHNTTSWQGASFNHKFPLTGKHKVSCTTCHTNATNYKVFDCTVCHEHSQSQMDPKHKEVRNYRFDSAACYQCHPNGRH